MRSTSKEREGADRSSGHHINDWAINFVPDPNLGDIRATMDMFESQGRFHDLEKPIIVSTARNHMDQRTYEQFVHAVDGSSNHMPMTYSLDVKIPESREDRLRRENPAEYHRRMQGTTLDIAEETKDAMVRSFSMPSMILEGDMEVVDWQHNIDLSTGEEDFEVTFGPTKGETDGTEARGF